MRTMSLENARLELDDQNVQFAPSATSAKLVYASAYIIRSKKHEDTILDIDAGVASTVSATFTYGQPIAIESEGKLFGHYLPGKGEALEASLVWLGAQQGARAIKHFDQNKGDDMSKELEAKVTTLQSKNTELQGSLDAANTEAQTAQAKLKAFTDVAGDHSPAFIKAALDEQAKTKSALVDGLVAFDRKAGKCGDDEVAMKAAKDKYSAWPTEALTELNTANKAVKGKGISGGDPNHTNDNAGDNELDACPV